MQAWARGNFTVESLDGTKQMNAEAVGKCQAFDDAIDYITKGE